MCNPIYKNKVQIRRNIKAIRCYLGLDKKEFAEKTGIGKRAIEFETGRLLPAMNELQKIADLAEINVSLIIYHHIQTKIEIQ